MDMWYACMCFVHACMCVSKQGYACMWMRKVDVRNL